MLPDWKSKINYQLFKLQQNYITFFIRINCETSDTLAGFIQALREEKELHL